MLKPVPPHEDEMAMRVITYGGARDGEVLASVTCVTEDGRRVTAFISNARPGYYKNVFVPWDFEHPEMLQ